MIKNCVVRTYPKGYNITTGYLDEKLREGWVVKMCMPYGNNGKIDCMEYILEREETE